VKDGGNGPAQRSLATHGAGQLGLASFASGATSGPHPTRSSGTTPDTGGWPMPQLAHSVQPALQVVRSHRFSLARRKPGVQVPSPPLHNNPGHRLDGSPPQGRRRPRFPDRAANGQQPPTKRPSLLDRGHEYGVKRTGYRPFDYETDARRRPGLHQTDLGCSRWMPRRSRRLPTDLEGSSGWSRRIRHRIGWQGKPTTSWCWVLCTVLFRSARLLGYMLSLALCLSRRVAAASRADLGGSQGLDRPCRSASIRER
jgi:hypothetical protein